MAQLPPKTPSMTQNWPTFPPHQQRIIPPPASTPSMLPPPPTTTAQHHPSWVDEFLDFTSARRGAHRRSMSDSVTFLEMPVLADECRDSFGPGANGGGFDRLDDEQLMSMFTDDLSGGGGCPVPQLGNSSNPSTPSDQNSNNNHDEENKAMSMSLDQEKQQKIQQQQMVQPKVEPGEDESSCKTYPHQPPLPSSHATANNDPVNIDPKRVKRILANRQSAQRSRVRKLQYISDLERSVTMLQTEVSALSPRVAFLDHQRLILNVDNSALKQRIAALAQDKIFKDAHQEALKKEIERLRQIYHQQSLRKMGGATAADPAAAATELLPAADEVGWTEKEQLITT